MHWAAKKSLDSLELNNKGENEMAKPLLSFPKNERYKVASQRINSKSMGLSYRAALDYMEKTKSMPKEEVK